MRMPRVVPALSITSPMVRLLSALRGTSGADFCCNRGACAVRGRCIDPCKASPCPIRCSALHPCKASPCQCHHLLLSLALAKRGIGSARGWSTCKSTSLQDFALASLHAFALERHHAPNPEAAVNGQRGECIRPTLRYQILSIRFRQGKPVIWRRLCRVGVAYCTFRLLVLRSRI